MPNIKSAKKRVLVTEKKALENKAMRSRMRNAIRKYNTATTNASNATAAAIEAKEDCEEVIAAAAELEPLNLVPTDNRKMPDPDPDSYRQDFLHCVHFPVPVSVRES